MTTFSNAASVSAEAACENDGINGHCLAIRGVTKAYRGTVAVDNVSLTVLNGSFLSLLGPSGSGKTTLLSLIAGFEQPDVGAISFRGKNLVGVPPEGRNFGMVFQGYALFPHLTVGENVAFPLKVRNVSRAEQARRVGQALDLVMLVGYQDRKPHEISGGQQQRVALARALVFEPDILLLDEPLSALDKKLRAGLQVELRDLQRRIGKTFLCVTHDQDEALSMSDQIAILRAGRLIQIGKPQDLFEQPRTHFVADFLGENNFIEGEVIRFVAGCVEFAAGGATFRQLARLQPGQKILMALRPSRIEMTEHEPTEGNRLRGVVIRIQYRGTELQSLVETSLGRLSVLQQAWRSGRHPIPGQSIWLRWSDDAGQIVTDDRTSPSSG